MNQIINNPILEKVVHDNNGVPVIFLPPWLKRLQSEVEIENGVRVFSHGNCLTDDQRLLVKAWCSEIKNYLMPASERDCGVEISRLLMAFPASDPGEMEMAVKMDVYLDAVAEFPLWALRYAAKQWLRGLGLTGKENFAFPPSPAQLAIYCRDKLGAFSAGYCELRDLLKVEIRAVIGPAERERMLKKMARLSDYQKHLAKQRELHLKGKRGSDVSELEFPTFEDFCKELDDDQPS